MTRSPWDLPTAARDVWLVAALLTLYVLTAKLGLTFALVHASASAVWPPTGLALGALLVFGLRLWPAIFVGAFLVNVTTAGSVLTSLGIATGNTLEAVIGAYLVQRMASGAACFDRPQSIFRFVVLAAGAATMVSATIGVSTLAAGGFAAWSQFGAIWLTWWLGDAAGALIVTPLVVLWLRGTPFAIPRERRYEAALMYVACIGLGIMVFAGPVFSRYPLAFLCLPPLAWAAFRFGPREVATAIVALTVVATWLTVYGVGSFVMATPNESLIVLQAFMATIALMMLPIAALVGQHRAALSEVRSANRAKDEFLAMLSHELRNPLQAMSNAVQILRQPNVDPQSHRLGLDIITRQSRHLTDLVSDLLDLTRVMAGKNSLALDPVNLQEAAQALVTECRTTGRCDRHTIEVKGEPVWVNADLTRVNQVLSNLLTNALKFTPAGGRIEVEVAHAGEEGLVRVTDNGIGISAELLPRIFDMFTQGERGLDRSEGGLGIGLTLVRRLVEQHGGRVEARSGGIGQGASFEIRLPRAPSPASAPSPRPAASVRSPRRRVLVVEDNADARGSLRMLLEAMGHDVYDSADGAAGVADAARLEPDVALIDIGLPGLDGYEVARRIRASGSATRLVALSGYAREEDKHHAFEAGFDEHLTKPAVPDELDRVLKGAREPPDLALPHSEVGVF